MSGYRLLFSITVQHDYFTGGLCRDLLFVPTGKSERLIKNANLLMRQSGCGVDLYCDGDQTEILRLYEEDATDPPAFIFKVYSQDPRFLNYTALDLLEKGRMLCFDNRKITHGKKKELRLTSEKTAGESDYEPMGDGFLGEILSKQEKRVRPHFVAAIFSEKNKNILFYKNGNPIERKYLFRFGARRTRWKYVIPAKGKEDNLCLHDPAGKVTFSETDNIPLPAGVQAVSFISDQALPLSEAPTRIFQLKAKKSAGDRVLIQRVPVASPENIQKASARDGKADLSEIFINL